MISTSAANKVSIDRNPRAAAAPNPTSRKIETTRPSRSIDSPNTTRLAATNRTGRHGEIPPLDSLRSGALSRSPCSTVTAPSARRIQHSSRGT